ncbi:MAG: hypothetical protein U0796_14575 [Gemmatales bacterium]
MKRRWSLIRLTLATLLLTVAVALYLFWPVAPLLVLSDEEYVGIDEARQILYSTTNGKEQEQLVKAYDLTAGQMLYSKALPCKPANLGHGTSLDWPLRLTSDGVFLIPMSAISGVMPAIRIADMKALSETPLSGMRPRACGMSLDGKGLVLQDLKVMGGDETCPVLAGVYTPREL